MGCTVRDKHICPNRSAQPPKSDSDSVDKELGHKSSLNPVDLQLGFEESAQNPNSNRSFDGRGWAYCREDQLEEVLLDKLDFVYNEVISKLVELGYDEDAAFNAVLRNGHCFGGLDLMANIFHNSLAYLDSGAGENEGDVEDSVHVCADMRQLKENALAGMVCLMQEVQPQMTKGDAMWSLLMSGLHVGRASLMHFSDDSDANGDGNGNSESSVPVGNDVEKVNSDSVRLTRALRRVRRGWGLGNEGTSDFPVDQFLSHMSWNLGLQREIEFPEHFTPSMKMHLTKNVAMFADGYRANVKETEAQSEDSSSYLSSGDSSSAVETRGEDPPPEETQDVKNQEEVNMMLNKFRDLNLEGDMEYVPEDLKDEMILSLVHQIMDLERQVKERKEWAHSKAMQAARKLCHDLSELKMLRMDREENLRLKQRKPAAEDPTMKRLSEMESALRKASGQVDRANAAVRRLEMENAEIRAEMEASKLSASESVTMRMEVAKREKKFLKKLLAWDKQRAKLQEDIATEKKRIIELQEEMLQVEAAKKAAEAKWRHEKKAKEDALAQLEEERRLKEANKANNKRRQEALRSKIELDLQRHKDDFQRLEQELSRLKADQQSTNLSASGTLVPQGQSQTIARLLHELDDSDDNESGIDRECIVCSKKEVSVVFLPCAHQVLCGGCNDEYGKAMCPICRVSIEQRVRIFGASS